jgi:Tfp pilus assembly protein PilE
MTYALIAWRFLRGLPWQVWVAVAIIAAIALAYRAGYNARDERADREMSEMLASVEAGQERARAAQQAALDAEQARYDELAERTQNAHETTRVVVRDATDRFIAERGVRQDNQCVASGTSAPASGDGAGLPAPVPTHVVVDQADVRACGDLYNYSVAAHLWAVGLADED